MKRIVALMLAFSLCFAGCGDETNKEPETKLPEIKYENFENYQNSLAVTDGEFVYIANEKSVFKAKSGTDDFHCIYTAENAYAQRLMLENNTLFLQTGDSLLSMDKNGENVQFILKTDELFSEGYRNSCFVLDGQIYLQDWMGKWYRYNDESANITQTEKTYYNSRGMQYKYVNEGQHPKGRLQSVFNERTIPAENYIVNYNSFILTDDYIYYITGQVTDFSVDVELVRCDANGGNTVVITQSDKEIFFAGYDKNNVYYYDFEYYYILNIETNEITKTDVKPTPNGVGNICDGKLYKLYTLNPTVTDFKTGITTDLTLK